MTLVVSVEFLRRGDPTAAEVVAGLEIANRRDHPEAPEMGNYDFVIWRAVGDDAVRREKGEVLDFPRVELNCWDLVFRCLQEVGLENRASTMRAGLRRSETAWRERAAEHSAGHDYVGASRAGAVADALAKYAEGVQ